MRQFSLELRHWLFAIAGIVIGACIAASCSTENELDVPVQTGDVVTNYKKAVQYEKTQQFSSDLDAFATYAINMQALRMTWWIMLSNGFANDNAFCATSEDINGKTGEICAEQGFQIIDEIVANADKYQDALDHLQYAGVLPDPTSPATRGWVADGADFIMNCRNSQVVGRQSVMAVLRQGGWSTDNNKLKQLFDQLPDNLRSGYSDYSAFWRDFSHGELDAKANQVFLNLYTYDHLDFGETAKDMGLTPGANMAKVGAKLIESGMNLVIDACPISTELGYGKDIYNTLNSTSNLITEGDVKGFIQTAMNNAINYGPQLYSFCNGGKWEGFDLFSADEWKEALSLEALSLIVNDALFSDTFKEAFNNGRHENLIPNMVTATDANGEKILLVCMVDMKTGQMTIGFSVDKDGNVNFNPKTPGTKQITVVGRDGKHKHKTIIVPETGETTVEVDLNDDSDETVLEENPADGYLKLDRKQMSFSPRSERLKTMIVSNYLYYACSTKDDWITCSIPSDLNELTVRVTANDTTIQRKGEVTVMATDSKGKVLKTVVLPVIQEGKEVTETYIKASPSPLVFDAEGGKLESLVTYNGGTFTGIDYDDELAGWITVDTKDAYNGWYTLVVDAKANNTGQERSGMITLYSAYSQEALNNAMNGYVDPDMVVSTTLLIKQQANKVVESKLKAKQIYISYYVNTNHGRLHDEIKFQDISQITTTQSGKGLHIVATATGTTEYGMDYNQTVEIDLTGNSEDWGDITKMNLSVKTKDTTGGYAGRRREYNLNTGRIPFFNYMNYLKSTLWDGTEESGLKINSFNFDLYTADDGNTAYSYEQNAENQVSVTIYWEE